MFYMHFVFPDKVLHLPNLKKPDLKKLEILIVEEDFSNLRSLYLDFLRLNDVLETGCEIHLREFASILSGLADHEFVLLSDSFYENTGSVFSNIDPNKLILVGDRQRFSQNHPTGIEQFLHIFLLPCRLSDISLLILQLERTREIMDLRPEGISADMLIRGIVLHYRKPNGTVFTHNAADILYVEAEADLCILHFLDDQGECRKITLQKNITAIEWNCNPKTFFRIHRKYLVNMLHVLDYGDYPGISLHLKTNGTPVELPLSRRRKLDFHNNYKYIRTLRNVLS